jgi:adenosylcobinamide kinase/adenosylcobinamide-phosphate guanylyltransferase
VSKIVLFTGGARSGKSTRAEQYTGRLERPVLYLATAEAGDDEMRERIALPPNRERITAPHWNSNAPPCRATR